MSAQAAKLIRASILSGEYSPGQRLIEADLVRRCKASHHVIREALQILEGDGLVVNNAYCGRSVFEASEKELEGILLVRISLECTAVSLAAYKITEDLARLLRQRLTFPEGGFKQFAQLLDWDMNIHYLIWEIADEPLLTQHLKRVISPFILQANAAWHREGKGLREQIEAHERIGDPSNHSVLVDAICSRDASQARAQMIRHLMNRPLSRQCESLVATAFPYW